MKRTIIFAHYDKDNMVDDYVVSYLAALRLLCKELIFVSDSDLSEEEKAKVKADKIIATKHGEYDFGSYKRGFEVMGDADELVFCNDSCYLIGDLEPIFNTKADFFGVVTNTDKYAAHLQSYFVVFRRKVIESDVFRNFMQSITKLPKKQEIIEKYEVGMTQTLLNAGFKASSFIQEEFRISPTATEDYFKKLRPSGFPLLKTEMLKSNPGLVCNVARWKEGLSVNDIKVINDHVSRMIGNTRNHWYITPFQRYFMTKQGWSRFLLSARIKNDKLTIKLLGLPILKVKI